MMPHIRDPRFTRYVFAAQPQSDGKIKTQSCWKDPITEELDIGSLITKMIDTEEECIRKSLIALGWTPPKEETE